MFDDWWKIYPRKIGKLDAAKAYSAAVKKGATDAELLAGLRNSLDTWRERGTDRAFIPHPGTWLRQGRWQDEDRANASTSTKSVQTSPDVVGCGTNISRRVDAALFSAYFSGCQFTETTVIAPSRARADYIINKFRHILPDMIVEVKNERPQMGAVPNLSR